MNGKLPIAIIWHMHQPYYRHPQTSEFVLPWVRLHASKDYLHMARLLQEFPQVKANFTMVPSLRDQLEDYARGADDEDTRVTMRTVDGDLTVEEKQHMLRRFFSIHHGNVIHRHEEYRRLLQLAMASQDRVELLSDDYFVDLAVWFNLAWLDPDDVATDDAAFQLEEAIASHERSFGKKPRGTWPAEGAVSPEAAAAIFKSGLEWFASDEGVLARSAGVELKRDEIGALVEPALLYRPYRTGGGTAIFRDRELSDRI